MTSFDYHALMQLRPTLFFAAWLSATLTLQAQTHQPESTPSAAPDSRPSRVSNSKLDANLFYQIILGELNATAAPGASFSLMLDAAQKTNDAALYQRAVELAIQARAGEPALQAAQSWKQAQPKNRDANIQVLQILLALNRLNESAQPLRSMIELSPAAERSAVISQVPRMYARISDKKAAALLVEHNMSDHLSHPATSAAAWTSVGRMRLAAADISGALEAATRAQRADAQHIGAALLGLEMMDPKLPAAEAILRRYLDTQKTMPEVRLSYARVLLDAQRTAEASQQILRVTHDKPELAQAWLIRGQLEALNNLNDLADQSYKKFLNLAQAPQAPKSQSESNASLAFDAEERLRGLTQAYLGLAQIAEKRRDFSLAESWLAKVESPAALVSTQNRRASMLAKQGKLQEARELIRKLPERSGELGQADRRTKLLSEIQLLSDNKQYQAAYDTLAQAIDRNAADPELLYQQANMAEKMRRYPEFERLLRQAIEIKPDFTFAYNALGYSFADRNVHLQEAKILLKKALELDPEDPAITDSLGWAEFRLGNHQEAITLLNKAFKMHPNAEIGAHLGEVYWVTGQRERAISIWKECLLLENDNEVLQETLKRFKVNL